MTIRLRELFLASLTATLLPAPTWADCAETALALVIDETSWPVTITSVVALPDFETDRGGVSLTFDARSARIVGQITTERVGETLAIENEGRLVLKSVLRGPAHGGILEIRGIDNARAAEIADGLCSG